MAAKNQVAWRSPLSLNLRDKDYLMQEPSDLFQNLEKLIASAVSICRLNGSLQCQVGGLITVIEELQRLLRHSFSEIKRLEKTIHHQKHNFTNNICNLQEQIKQLKLSLEGSKSSKSSDLPSQALGTPHEDTGTTSSRRSLDNGSYPFYVDGDINHADVLNVSLVDESYGNGEESDNSIPNDVIEPEEKVDNPFLLDSKQNDTECSNDMADCTDEPQYSNAEVDREDEKDNPNDVVEKQNETESFKDEYSDSLDQLSEIHFFIPEEEDVGISFHDADCSSEPEAERLQDDSQGTTQDHLIESPTTETTSRVNEESSETTRSSEDSSVTTRSLRNSRVAVKSELSGETVRRRRGQRNNENEATRTRVIHNSNKKKLGRKRKSIGKRLTVRKYESLYTKPKRHDQKAILKIKLSERTSAPVSAKTKQMKGVASSTSSKRTSKFAGKMKVAAGNVKVAMGKVKKDAGEVRERAGKVKVVAGKNVHDRKLKAAVEDSQWSEGGKSNPKPIGRQENPMDRYINLDFLLTVNQTMSDLVMDDNREEMPVDRVTERGRRDIINLAKLYRLRVRMAGKHEGELPVVLVKGRESCLPKPGEVDALLSTMSETQANKIHADVPKRRGRKHGLETETSVGAGRWKRKRV